MRSNVSYLLWSMFLVALPVACYAGVERLQCSSPTGHIRRVDRGTPGRSNFSSWYIVSGATIPARELTAEFREKVIVRGTLSVYRIWYR